MPNAKIAREEGSGTSVGLPTMRVRESDAILFDHAHS